MAGTNSSALVGSDASNTVSIAEQSPASEASASNASTAQTATPRIRSRKTRESEADRAIRVVKELIALKLQVQQGREQTAKIQAALEKLFSNVDISQEEALELQQQLDSLAAYVLLRSQYREAHELAKDALKLLQEADIEPEEVSQF